jgi:hypothetical protein
MKKSYYNDIPQPFKKYPVKKTYSVAQVKKAIELARSESFFVYNYTEEEIIKSLKPRKR